MNWLRFSVLFLPFILWGQAATLKSDESALLFPTYGAWNADKQSWEVNIRAWVFEIEPRRLTLPLARKALGFDTEEMSEAEQTIFLERAKLFLADNERGKRLQIKLSDEFFPLKKTAANGHSQTLLRLTTNQLDGLIHQASGAPTWLNIEAFAGATNTPTSSGWIGLIPPVGVSVISDIDDTIKISEITNHQALMQNTFLKPFTEAPGMASLYQQWASNGVAFHYVSASPWQLYPALEKFREEKGFPRGTFHQKSVRFRDRTLFNLFNSPDDYKRDTIEPILKQFPQRQFILVGDSGERDPEIYGRLARKFPEQIMAIYIRDVTGESVDAMRYQEAFKGVGREKWQIFKEPSEIMP